MRVLDKIVSLYKFDYTVISTNTIHFSGDINAIQGTMLDIVKTSSITQYSQS